VAVAKDPTASGVINKGNGNADSSAGSSASSTGGNATGTGNGGNGGDGGSAVIAKASIGGGDVTSGNFADVSQSTHQNIVVVPVAVQLASAKYNGLSHASQ
jgi:hypothetical protein